MCLLFVFHGTYFSTPLLQHVCILQPQAGLGVRIHTHCIVETDSKW